MNLSLFRGILLIRIIGLVLLATVCNCAVAIAQAQQESCTRLNNMIKSTYDFRPSKLNEDQQSAKSKEMDEVWNLVKSDRQTYVPCLKAALATPDLNNFFEFDASNLLFVLEPGDESKSRIAQNYAKVFLDDVDQGYWMRYVAPLGWEGYDTSGAGDNWLRTENPGYYLPQHGTRKVDKYIGAYIIFGSMDERFATPALIRISRDHEHPGRMFAIEMLLQMQNPESNKAFGELVSTVKTEKDAKLLSLAISSTMKISPREGNPKNSRDEFLVAFDELVSGKGEKFASMMTRVSDGEKDAAAVLTKEDISLLRKVRRYFAALANPHSAEYYRTFTGIIVAINKREDSR